MDTTKKLPTVLSLCTGYGGIERGLDLAGVEHQVIAHVEIEAFAIANLVAKMEAGKLDAAPVWSNLKTLPVEPFRDRVDILTGGYPCQPFSAAGKRLGEEDPRHLWPYIRDIIRAVRPVRCFFENVEGHISLGLREVISDLESLGYKVAWGIFSAREVGAPHQRKRVYIMADSEGEHARDVGKNIWAPSGEINPFIDSGGFGRGHDRQENRKTLAYTDNPRSAALRRNANACREEISEGRTSHAQRRFSGCDSDGCSEDLANSSSAGVRDNNRATSHQGWGDSPERREAVRQDNGEGILADTEDFGLQRPSEARDTFTKRTQPDDQQPYGCDSTYIGSWPPEPGLGRVVDGCADRLDRIRLLGNGVVPKTAAKAWSVLSEDLCS